MRDQIIALSECVPRDVPDPIGLGAFRATDSEFTWQDEARAAVKRQDRAVLSGDIENFDEIAQSIAAILADYPYAKFALLIHAKQALASRPQPYFLTCFENVYVATSEEIEPAEILKIGVFWSPTWVLTPKSEINRADWIPQFLIPSRQGRLLLLATQIEPDELRLQLEDFAFEHPLIEIRPCPHEWFVPSELGPWRTESRNPSRAELVQDSRTRDDYSLSVIIPFRWTGDRRSTEMLSQSLQSVADALAAHDPFETIIAVDRNRDCEPFMARDLVEAALVDVKRINDSSDWRAGFIRNCGANVARNKSGIFLFIDADVAIASSLALSNSIHDSLSNMAADIFQVANSDELPAFGAASSSLLLIRSSLFTQLGGFSPAFSHYGCEDNYLIWCASQRRARIYKLPISTIKHLRDRLESDDLVAKMIRLRTSAELMYRMTLDPEVHLHFFSSLGLDLWIRAFLKRAAAKMPTRALLAPLVFVVTLIETRDRMKYFTSFVEVFSWKLKRPVLWVRSNTWRTELVSHAWRANAWKLPNFFVSLFGAIKVAIERGWINLRASRFGWNSVSWRLRLWLKYAVDQLRWRASVAQIRFSGACLWILTMIVTLFSETHWILTVGIGRIYGQINRGLGEVHRIFIVYLLNPAIYIATRPRAFWQLHAWRILKVSRDLEAELWIFRAPTEWFKVRTPNFYRWVWRPLLKVRYFFEYHLITRWRKT